MQKITKEVFPVAGMGTGFLPTTKASLKEMRSIVEKLKVENPPSNLAVVGRYILTPRIFNLLRNTTSGVGGEIQLTDAIFDLLHYEAILAYTICGTRYDCGNKLGYLQATIGYGLKHPEVSTEFKQYLSNLINGLDQTDLSFK